MEASWNYALWRQFGATVDMLENAVVACPDDLWRQRLWNPPQDQTLPAGFAEFWYVTYHALFWLDLYLSGLPEEEFTPPTPFARTEIDPESGPAGRSYTKMELLGYLAGIRQRLHATLINLTAEQAGKRCEYPWSDGNAVSYLELQLYNMRHIQEHAAQLSLFLGQHGVPDEAVDWVVWAKGDEGH